MRIVAVVLAGLCASVSVDALADTWLVATVGSYHANRDRGYNERNYGLGVEHDIAQGVRAVGGFYENSYYRTSVYGGVSYMPWSAGSVHAGVSLIAVTGYRNPVRVVPLPVIAVEGKRVGINVGIAPSLNRGLSMIGLQVKAKF